MQRIFEAVWKLSTILDFCCFLIIIYPIGLEILTFLNESAKKQKLIVRRLKIDSKRVFFKAFYIFLSLFALIAFAGVLEREVNFDIENLSFTKIKGYDFVSLEGCISSTVELGAPCLPKASVSLLIPQGAEITDVEIVSLDTEEITGTYNIYPTQPSQPFIKDKVFPFVEPDEDIYNQANSFPEKVIQSIHTGSMGGYKLASLLVYPLQYIPAEKKLVFYSRIKFKITYEENLRSLNTKTEKQNKIFKERIEKLILNPEDIGMFEPPLGLRGSLDLPADTVEYVIITTDSFKTTFQELADWKTKKGIPAKVVTLDSIYANYTGADNAERIRNFLKEANSSWGTIWVLLGGQCDYEWGQEIVPRRNVWYRTSYVGHYPDEDTIPSDLYFSDLDGDWNADGDNIYGESTDDVDLYSDVFVGRAPVRTVAQAETFVNKVLTYEKNPPSGYQKKILLPAAYLWPSIYDETLSQEAIANIVPGDWQVSRMYERNGDLTKEAFVDSVRAGFGFAHLVGHGNEYGIYIYYGDEYFSSDDLDALGNNELLGIHNSIGCMCGALDLVPYGDCFAEHYLTPSTGGSYSIMNSRYGWGSPPGMGPSEHIDTCFYHEIFKEDYTYHDHLGVAHAFSKDGYVSEVSWYANWAWSIYELNLFGDPEMPLWTDNPGELTVNHNVVIPIGGSTFTVNVTEGGFGVEGALVCLYKEREVYQKGYTDASGNITLTLSPPPSSLGIMYCTVTKNNFIPYEGNVNVISPSGPWVIFEEYTVTDLSGTDNNVDPGDSIELFLTVHNVGLDTAYNITGILRTEDAYVNITDSLEDFGDILADSLSISVENFDFDVLPGCPVNHVINFELITSDVNDSTWNSNFSVPILTPDISLSPDTLDFDTVYIGYPDTLELLVKNDGGDTLTVSDITSDNIDYSVDIDNFSLPPDETQIITVMFAPVSAGLSTGTLTIESNDLDLASATVFLKGEGLEPPDISVSPDSLSDSLFTDEISVDTLTIYNTGSSNLNFDIAINIKTSVLKELSQRNKNTEIKKETKSLISSTNSESPEFSELEPYETAGEIDNFTIGEPRELAYPRMFEDDFEDGDYDGWLDAGGTGTKEVTNSTAAKGTNYSYHEYSSPRSHYNGIYQEFDSIQPGYIGFYIRSGSTGTSDTYCVLRNSIGYDAIWFFADQSGHLYVNGDVGGDQSFDYSSETWYHIEFKNIDFVAKTFDYYVNEELIKAGIPFRNAPAIEEISRIDVYNYTEGSEAWWDEFLIATEEFTLIYVDCTSSTIPSGNSAQVEVTFDATGLYGGNYYADIIINSNDPDESEVIVPANLNVTGIPDITVSEDTINYDIVFTGYSSTDTLFIRNVGTDLLTVNNISSDNSDFTVDVINFSVNPEEMQAVAVTCTPSTLGIITGTLTIQSDDPDEPTVEISLRVECLEPPDISVSPDSLSDSLLTGQTSTHNLTVHNTGASDLILCISDKKIDTVPIIFTNSIFTQGSLGKKNSRSKRSIEGKIATENSSISIFRTYDSPTAGETANIAILGSDDSGSDLYLNNIAQYLINSGRFASVATINAFASTPTLAELQTYDVVGVFGWNYWNNPDSIGNVLADYVDAGGNVFIAFAANGTGGNWMVEGRFDSENYWLISPYSYDGDISYSMGTVFEPAHPIMDGVSTLISRSKLDPGASVSEGATLLAEFEDGSPLIAVKELERSKRIDISFPFFTSSVSDWGIDTTSDVRLLIINAFDWLSGPTWLSENPTSDTISAGDSLCVEVTFDATGLYGGNYYADIIINSNDPDESEVAIPAHLHVTGAPDITVSEDTLDYGTVFSGSSATDTLIVSNEGTDTLTISNIATDYYNYIIDTTNFTLNPKESQEVVITFTPISLGTIIRVLRIECDDPDESNVTLFLRGECVEPPDISVSTDSLSDTLLTDQTSTHLLTIYNTGLSDLNLDILIEEINPFLKELEISKKPPKDSPTSIALESLKPEEAADGVPSNFVTSTPRAFASPKIFGDDFEDGDYNGWLEGDGYGIKEVTNATAANGTEYSYHEYESSANSHYDGIYQELGVAQPGYISFYIRSGSNTTHDAYVVLTNSLGEDVIFFFARGSGYLYVNANVGGDETYTYTAETWYHIEFKNIDFVSKTFDYYVNEVLIKAGIPFRDASTTQDFNRLDLYNFTEGSQAWWDEILIATEEFPTWVMVDTARGTVPAGDSIQIEVLFDAAGMNVGNYYANIIIESNDPSNSEVRISAHMQVATGSGTEEAKIPEVFFVKQNYPNPFNSQTSIRYGCPKKAKVCIQVFDITGRIVNTLIDKEVEAGYHEVMWEGNNKFGRKVANAVYFYRIQAGDFTATKKMIFLQ